MKVRTVALLLTFALGLLAAPVPAEAQQAGKVYRIGWLGPTYFAEVLFKELRDLGWAEGQNITSERRDPAGKPERLPEMAAN